jgi:nucleoside 2-deoxyribosyltransferase
VRLFICAPEEYHEDTDELAALLEKNGHIVYYSYRDTPRDITHEEIFLNNLILIRNADIFISHFTRDGLYTIDLAVELGIAAETMKPILGLIEVDSEQVNDFYENLDGNIMFKEAFSYTFNKLDDLLKYLEEQ